MSVEYLTAESESGRQALAEVFSFSYAGEMERTPPGWARVRVVDGVPVAYILVDPDRQMDQPRGTLPFAFINDVATREDRRGEGHFRALMEDTLVRLREAGHFLVITHGRYPLYRRFGFDVFTHHCGIFITPEQIERRLGRADADAGQELLRVEEHHSLLEGLLLIRDIEARFAEEYAAALRAAAALARERGRARILFEHPAAPSYGSRYPLYASPETPFTALARACGAQVVLQGADPEAGAIPDADWIKVLDASALLTAALPCSQPLSQPLPTTAISLDTEAGVVTFYSAVGGVTVSGLDQAGVERVRWPAAAVAQLVAGYSPVEVLCAVHNAPLPADGRALLGALFPPCWRFSRNESWVYRI